MSDVTKIATRDSYGNALVELGKEHEDLIVLDADLAGATKTCIFQKEFPERHWDCGIAECNMTGIAAGYRAQGITDVPVVGFAGDGGTADIGIQALSGAIDRNDDILYICYDNEAYMNTGIQKSSLTPYGSSTTTTPVCGGGKGNLTDKKNLFEIVAAHGIPYAATATVGNMPDLIKKIQKAAGIKGTRFIHVLCPCPVGWGIKSSDTVDIAREAVESGLWVLAEYQNGEFFLSKKPKEFSDVKNFIKKQRRFAHLTDEDIEKITESRNKKWNYINNVYNN